MSDRGFFFLLAVLIAAFGLGLSGWLLATGRAASGEGLRMTLGGLAIGALFTLYIWLSIRRAGRTES